MRAKTWRVVSNIFVLAAVAGAGASLALFLVEQKTSSGYVGALACILLLAASVSGNYAEAEEIGGDDD